MMRIAIPPIGGPHWLGGWNYLVNMASALAASGREDIETIIFLGDDIEPTRYAELREYPRTQIVVSSVFNAGAKARRLARALATGIDSAANDVFAGENIDVAFEPATYFGWRFPIPAVAWLPDFQHVRMPHLFTRVGRWRREIGFRAQIASGRTIMVSSHDAENDVLSGYGNARGRTKVVRFAVRPPNILSREEVERRLRPLGVSGALMILPNQLWVHKNHRVVIDALAKAQAQGCKLTIAATGAAHDPRAPQLADELRQQITAAGLDNHFRLLGVVPFGQLEALMQRAIGLINPSRFEGWSTPVEEAKARGMPMLLSDIPVHHEQADGLASFFGVDDPDRLVDLLLDIERTSVQRDHAQLVEACVRAEVAHRQFGNELAKVFSDAAEARKT